MTTPGAAARPALTVETITSPGGLIALERRWNDLLEESPVDHPFLTHECVRTAWECFGSGNMLHLLAAREGEKLRALAPLMLGQERVCGLRLRRLAFIYHVALERLEILASREHPEGVAAIGGRLRFPQRPADRWDLLLLQQIPLDSETSALAPGLEAQGFLTGRWLSSEPLVLPLRGSWAEYEKTLDAKHRYNTRSRLKRLSCRALVDLEMVTGGDGLAQALEDGLRIEALAWKERAGTAINSHPAARRFYLDLARRCARRGWLRLYFLTAGRRRIAFGYMLHYRNAVYLLKSGYDPEYAVYSPFTLLLHAVLERLHAEGVSRFEFLGQADRWKTIYTTRKRPHAWLYIFRPGLAGLAAHGVKFRILPWARNQRLLHALRRAGLAALRRHQPLPGSTC